MKINEKIFSLPPYISTTWNNIQSIHLKGSVLVVTLSYGEAVNIPGLKPETIELIFAAHAMHLEQEGSTNQGQKSSAGRASKNDKNALMFSMEEAEMPFRLGFSNMEGIGSAMQHNQAYADAPDLPKEILQKIGSIAKIVAPDESVIVPKAEPHCNCPHCQIARAIQDGIHPTSPPVKKEVEEEVSEEELRFQQWEITQTGDKMYSVVNRLDKVEQYNVYLGEPVGCTCGKEGCEHLLAVLRG